MISGYKIVDGHVHTYATDKIAHRIIQAFNEIYDIKFENPGTGSIEDVRSNMNKEGIDYTVMANFAPPKILHKNNLWSLEASKNNKGLVPLVSFHPEMEGALTELLEDYIERGARGIKFHPMAQGFEPGHKGIESIYDFCNETGFPIVFHCGRVSNARLNEYSDLDMILPLIEKYKEIPFVLTHMADGDRQAVVSLSRSYDNVFFDTSIVITGYPSIMDVNEPSWLDDQTVIETVNEIGAHRMLFGSDYPWGSPGHDIKRFLKMNLSRQQKELILGLNSIKLFKIE
ncbi:amidohydrolase family protein [Anaerobacterium chartisolvens]|nr:amidohydrolase family protein [Anaerobacterium chartisolvens]